MRRLCSAPVTTSACLPPHSSLLCASPESNYLYSLHTGLLCTIPFSFSSSLSDCLCLSKCLASELAPLLHPLLFVCFLLSFPRSFPSSMSVLHALWPVQGLAGGAAYFIPKVFVVLVPLPLVHTAEGGMASLLSSLTPFYRLYRSTLTSRTEIYAHMKNKQTKSPADLLSRQHRHSSVD